MTEKQKRNLSIFLATVSTIASIFFSAHWVKKKPQGGGKK